MPLPRPCRRHLRVLLLVIAALHASWMWAGAQRAQPIVVLVSIDGWRWDYLQRYEPPTLSRLAADGVRAEGLVPVFPSKTFPNHYSIVTGLYPARHGIISNNMRDPGIGGRFALGNVEVVQDTRWWGGEPLWITAERQGQRAATMFWPGSDVEIAGGRPTYWRQYDQDVSMTERVDQVLEWLGRPEPHRPTFLTLYFHEVDDAGHDHGPDAEETRAAALAVDAMLARLVAGVERLGVAPRVNYLFVSDHGMAALSRDRVIVLDDYLDLASVELIDSAPIVGLNVRAGATVEDVFRRLAGKHPALAVYTRDTLPEGHRLRSHPRLPDVIGIADDGWHTTTRSRLERDGGAVPGGNHGYESTHRSMHGLFVGWGPQFRRGAVVPPFESLHLYELMCRLLSLRPAANDGDPAVTAALLR